MAPFMAAGMARTSALRNFHLPLPGELHEALVRAAHDRGKPATEIARQAIREWLEARRREVVAEEIASYARAMAGSRADLDEALEKAGLEELRRVYRRRGRS